MFLKVSESTYFIFCAASNYIEKQINITSIHTCHVIQHYDFSIRSVGFVKQIFLKSLLLFHCSKVCVVKVFC